MTHVRVHSNLLIYVRRFWRKRIQYMFIYGSQTKCVDDYVLAWTKCLSCRLHSDFEVQWQMFSFFLHFNCLRISFCAKSSYLDKKYYIFRIYFILTKCITHFRIIPNSSKFLYLFLFIISGAKNSFLTSMNIHYCAMLLKTT